MSGLPRIITICALLLGTAVSGASASVTAGNPEPAVAKRVLQNTDPTDVAVTAPAVASTVRVHPVVLPAAGNSGLIAAWDVIPVAGNWVCTSGSIWTPELAVGAGNTAGVQLSMTDTAPRLADNVSGSGFVCGTAGETVYLGVGYRALKAGSYKATGYFYTVAP
ncbi:hypothetical protein AH448_04585 [Salmonella enterica subsp. diarizonae]|uniref:Uncharacterized protein n=5 Tax=Salmonella enterica TaxID=28901 RepID=A0A5X8Y0F4_SALNE|nr:hypothetical protein [Salmonella enterica]EAA7933124.1 hypothetical protein [Salmonella enterica subsp. enterica serovar Redlands]EAA8760835.1 hypothetical protein [Salmonella enterica subsp. enterica serovar Rubislaw]EAB9742181.1 hypothetical protein [Salmonella enterica subsp. diarizonae]EAB9791113.1 hypothetical protein [Salmonella enterica subsp. enterica serovar Muenchen]EAW1164010.1 hypothetical protein [Salmonella enterica subsp. enterica]EBS4087675.1 hypothetical protein [Salmonell